MAIQSGDIVGDYQVIDHVGTGGMGAVYKIEHRITKRIEAMKLLTIGISSTPEEIQRFEREIQVQARLNHPNIAALYNAVRDGRSIALIMEYVEGESLQNILERGRLPLRTAVEYACQVLDALAYAHHQAVIHRDVAPANILITREGVAKLTDFGLARAATDLRLTISGVAVGSPWYMSPEQVKAVGEVDARTDLYSMGAVLYEMLTGRKMFEAEGSFAVMCGQMETIPDPPSVHNPEVSTALDEVVAKALAKDPAERFQSAADFRLALASAFQAGEYAAMTPGVGRRLSRSVAMALVLVTGTAVGAVCTARWWPKTPRVAAQSPATQPAAPIPQPAIAPPLTEPPPQDAAVATPIPEAPLDGPRDESQNAASAVRPVRRPAKPAQSFALKVTGGVVDPPAPAAPRPGPPAKELDLPMPTPVKQSEAATEPEERPAATAAKVASDAPVPVPSSSGEAKPPKAGNRFVRALGKLNPFGKGPKDNGGDSAKPAAKKN